jgi:hypothetical protein
VTSKMRGHLEKTQFSRLLLVLSLASTFALAGFGAQQSPPDVNIVKSIRAATVDSVPVIEIELHSSREFPVRDQVVVLRIGKTDFLRSRSPSDGSLKTLIFILTPDDFGRLADGDAMSVRYGLEYSDAPTAQPSGADETRWDFGRLNKALLIG